MLKCLIDIIMLSFAFSRPNCLKKEPKFYNKRNPSPHVPNLGFLKIKITVTTVAALGVCPIPFPAARFAQSGAGITISVRLENHPSRSCIWS